MGPARLPALARNTAQLRKTLLSKRNSTQSEPRIESKAVKRGEPKHPLRGKRRRIGPISLWGRGVEFPIAGLPRLRRYFRGQHSIFQSHFRFHCVYGADTITSKRFRAPIELYGGCPRCTGRAGYRR